MRQTAVSKFDMARALSDGLKKWNKLAERDLSVLGLTLSEFRALKILFETGPRLMITLAMEQGMTAPGMTIVIDKLEEAGLARRVRSDADRRAINVAITGKGGEKFKRALKLYDKFVERAVNGMSTQEIDSFLIMLNRILGAANDKTNIT